MLCVSFYIRGHTALKDFKRSIEQSEVQLISSVDTLSHTREETETLGQVGIHCGAGVEARFDQIRWE